MHCRRKYFEAVPAGRKKKLKLLDINSEQEIQEPDEELLKDPELPAAEKGIMYCNSLFYLEPRYKSLPADEKKTDTSKQSHKSGTLSGHSLIR